MKERIVEKSNYSKLRKHFFINKRLQGRYMVMFFIPMFILLVFMLVTLYFATQSILSTTTTIIQRDIDAKLALTFQDQEHPTVDQYKNALNTIEDYIQSLSSNRDFRHEMLVSLLWVFGIGIFLVIVQLVLLTIFYSHKLAGPIYRFEKVCQSIIAGNYTEVIRLRKGDEMQNLAVLMNQMIAATNHRLNVLQGDDSEKKKEISENLTLTK